MKKNKLYHNADLEYIISIVFVILKEPVKTGSVKVKMHVNTKIL